MVPWWLVSSYQCDATARVGAVGHTSMAYSVPLCRRLAIMMSKARLKQSVGRAASSVALFPVLLMRVCDLIDIYV